MKKIVVILFSFFYNNVKKKTYFQESWLANMEFDELVRVAVDDKRQAKCNLYRGRSKEFKVVRS